MKTKTAPSIFGEEEVLIIIAGDGGASKLVFLLYYSPGDKKCEII